MTADKSSGEIVLSRGINTNHEVLLQIDPGVSNSLRWKFEVNEGKDVEFTIHLVTGLDDSSQHGVSNPLLVSNPLRLVDLTLSTEQKIRDSYLCKVDEGICQIPERQGKVLILFRWSIPQTASSFFSSFFCSSSTSRNVSLGYQIEVLKTSQFHEEQNMSCLNSESSHLDGDLCVENTDETYMSHALPAESDILSEPLVLDSNEETQQTFLEGLQDDIVDFFSTNHYF